MSSIVSRICNTVHYVSSGSTVTSSVTDTTTPQMASSHFFTKSRKIPSAPGQNVLKPFCCNRCGRAIRKDDNVFMYQDQTFCSRGCREGIPGYEEALNIGPIVRSDTHTSELCYEEMEVPLPEDLSSSEGDLLNRKMEFHSSGDLQKDDSNCCISCHEDDPTDPYLFSPAATSLLLFTHVTDSPLMSGDLFPSDRSSSYQVAAASSVAYIRNEDTPIKEFQESLSPSISLVKLINA